MAPLNCHGYGSSVTVTATLVWWGGSGHSTSDCLTGKPYIIPLSPCSRYALWFTSRHFVSNGRGTLIEEGSQCANRRVTVQKIPSKKGRGNVR